MNKILLLEDDPILQRSLVKLLTKEGFEVDVASDANEAINLTFENRYDLYLLDMNVPVLSGDKLLKELRESGDKTPAIIITAMIDTQSIKKGFDAGADDYIKKPFDIDELIIRIKAKMKGNLIKFKEFTIDPISKKVYKDGVEFPISNILKEIFISLVKAYPNYISKDDLMAILNNPSDVALRVNISKLKKLCNIEIENRRGVGYKII